MSKYVHHGSEHPVECFANELQYLYVVIPLSTPRIFRSWLLKCLLLKCTCSSLYKTANNLSTLHSLFDLHSALPKTANN